MQTPVSLFSSPPLASPPVQVEAVDKVLSAEEEMHGLAAKAEGCRLCGLAESRCKVVFGRGAVPADLLFIGEAPGRDEDIQGEVFVGRSGQLLNRMLMAAGLNQKQFYIMNTIKCRPPNNRDPKREELEACNLWFKQQIALLQPKVICLLGRVAAQAVLQENVALGEMRGRWHTYQGIPVWVTYHPAYLLRSPQQKRRSWQDLLQLVQRYHELCV